MASVAQFDNRDAFSADLIEKANNLIEQMAINSTTDTLAMLESPCSEWGELNISQLSIVCNNKQYFQMPIVTKG